MALKGPMVKKKKKQKQANQISTCSGIIATQINA
jgi:hypothetical protein